MAPRVIVTHWVHPEVIDLLRGSFQVVANPTRETPPGSELLRRARTAQALIVFWPDAVDEALLRECPDLKIVAGTSRELGSVNVVACTNRDVWVTVPPRRLAVRAAGDVTDASLRIELDAAANVFEALSGKVPKGAVNKLGLRMGRRVIYGRR